MAEIHEPGQDAGREAARDANFAEERAKHQKGADGAILRADGLIADPADPLQLVAERLALGILAPIG